MEEKHNINNELRRKIEKIFNNYVEKIRNLKLPTTNDLEN